MDCITGFSYDATSSTYTISFSTSQGNRDYSDPLKSRVISYLPADVIASSNNGFETYQHADTVVPGQTDTLQIRQLGTSAGGIVLSYVRYGIQSIGDGVHFQEHDYFVFGTPTVAIPTTGTADYTGIIDGTYNQSTLGQTYTMTGTATLHADFASAKFSTKLDFTGVNAVSGGTALGQQIYNIMGSITASSPNQQLSATFTNSAGDGSGQLQGNFYGAHADEFGEVFSYTSPTDHFSGVAVGKK